MGRAKETMDASRREAKMSPAPGRRLLSPRWGVLEEEEEEEEEEEDQRLVYLAPVRYSARADSRDVERVAARAQMRRHVKREETSTGCRYVFHRVGIAAAAK
jgi:hypothetical protein